MAKRLHAIGSKWTTAKVRRVGGKVQVKVNPRVARNVAAGFYDEDGYFHPLRASYDYDPKRAGEKARRK